MGGLEEEENGELREEKNITVEAGEGEKKKENGEEEDEENEEEEDEEEEEEEGKEEDKEKKKTNPTGVLVKNDRHTSWQRSLRVFFKNVEFSNLVQK